jgi:pyridoxamine 5'-phosphate oxidase
MRLADLRKQYRNGTLELEDLDADPLHQFGRWLAEAVAADLLEPNAMALATVAEGGVPRVRMVLLKGLERGRFLFYTNLESDKARELANTPRCALTFWWDALERQVRIEGSCEPASAEEADAYFASRPRESQLGAWCSPQSRAIESRAVLQERLAAVAARYPGEVPRPPFWGGYAVTPETVEFWQGRASRLHDRFRYRRHDSGWQRMRLAP